MLVGIWTGAAQPWIFAACTQRTEPVEGAVFIGNSRQHG